MQIRFLQTVASENPAFPFQPGQVITVASPGPFLQRVLDSGAAEIVRIDETERAIEPPSMPAEAQMALGRNRGARMHAKR